MSLSTGDRLNLEPNAGSAGTNICQDIKVLSGGLMSMVVAPTLCVGVSHDSVAGATTIALVSCDPENSAQKWAVPPKDSKPSEVKHISSGLCLSGNAAGVVRLGACGTKQSWEPEADHTAWVLGASGRLCGPDGCLSVVAGQSLVAQSPHSFTAEGTRRSFLR